MRGVFPFYVIAIILLSSTRTRAKTRQSDASTSNCQPYRFSGMPGIPGTSGIPGIPGAPGLPGGDGSKGDKGSIGKRGLQGAMGIPGKIGPRGLEGSKGEKGERGPIGTKGSAGVPGNIGPRGPRGLKGESGTKREKGDSINIDPSQRANWKQCAWRQERNTDNGKIKECSFNKLHSNTALKVAFQGNIRVFSSVACNRWFFKFNGTECVGPLTIDSALFTNWKAAHATPNILRHHSFEGFCENLTRGTVSVELWVGKCTGQTLGDAYTGWYSVSRIMIEEVPPPQ